VPALPRAKLRAACSARHNTRERTRDERLAARLSRTALLCLDDFDDGGGDYCYSASDALAGRAFASADGPESRTPAPDPSDLPVSVSALVPDDARTIEATYPGEPRITAAVTNNFATFLHTIHIKPNAHHFPNFNPSSVVFRRADGSVLMTSHPPVDEPRFGGR
jgi:hypothetical protein